MSDTRNTMLGLSSLTQSILADLEQLGEEISSDIAERDKLRRHVARIRKALGENNLEVLVRLLAKKKQDENLARLYPKARMILERLQVDVERRLDEMFVQLFERLEAYCDQASISLRGRAPNFVIDSLLDVRFDRKKGTVKVGNTFLRTLEWDKISATIQEERQRIWERPFDSSGFRDELLEIHAQLIRLKPSPTGWVRLEDVYQVLKEREQERNPNWRTGGRLVPYYKDEFSADLSKSWDAQASGQLPGQQIELSGIRDPRVAFKVALPGGGTETYGHLRPKGR